MKHQSLHNKDTSIWTVQDAKAKLSEVLRRAREVGPQKIGTTNPCVVVSEDEWRKLTSQRPSIGRWLVTQTPRGDDLELPDRREPSRPMPFSDTP